MAYRVTPSRWNAQKEEIYIFAGVWFPGAEWGTGDCLPANRHGEAGWVDGNVLKLWFHNSVNFKSLNYSSVQVYIWLQWVTFMVYKIIPQ